MTDAYVRPDVQMILTMLAQSEQPLMSEVEPAAAREMYNVMAAMLEAEAVDLARIEDCPAPAQPATSRSAFTIVRPNGAPKRPSSFSTMAVAL